VQTDEPVVVSGFGSVQPKSRLIVQPQVTGHIVSLNPQLDIGGYLGAGETLLQIDPRDYEISVEVAKAAVATAEFQYKLEQGNQVIAAREWELLDETARDNSLARQLALRKPQLREKKASLEAAQSGLRKAQLDLERTKIVSPFAAVVLEESAEIGKFVSPQSSLAVLAATDEFYVEVKIPRRELSWLPLAQGMDFVESPVEVAHDLGSEEKNVREARLLRLLGDVDKTGRMVRVLVAVPDPLNMARKPGVEPLLLGSYVQASIVGKTVKDVYRLPRSAFREGNRVWIYSAKGVLEYRDVDLVFSDGEMVIVRGALEPGDKVITSALETPLEGLTLELASQKASSTAQ
jgi:RND family efflux transporter MFP subunit